MVVAGPDGVGKSALCDGIVREVFAGRRILRFHHRPGALPYRARRGAPVEEPHGDPPYGRALGVVKSLFVFFDYALGWSLRLRPFVRGGGWVLIERGWWDLAVDPARYRIREPARLVRALGRILPRPTVTLVLEAPTEVLLDRKTELPGPELERQMRAWRSLSEQARATFLDASLPAGEVLRVAEAAIAARESQRVPAGRSFDWAGLPRPSSPRWLVPRGPRTVAARALHVYHPVTTKGRVGWTFAKLFASAGGMRLAPRVEDPSAAGFDQSALADLVPPGGSIAYATTNHRGRFVAMIFDRDANAVAAVKVARDDRSRALLDREAEAIESLGPRLGDPLSSPRVLTRSEGLLALEAIDWIPRPRAWEIPPDVATALGAFSKTGAGHGDFAPWNALRTSRGWTLIDWEEASEQAEPFRDIFHWLVQSHALLGRPSTRGLRAGLAGEGWCGAALRSYANAAGVSLDAAAASLSSYLKESSSRIDPGEREGPKALRARLELLEVFSL